MSASYSLTLRSELSRKITSMELDENFLYLEEIVGEGSQGSQGPQGSQGDQGYQGTQGFQGDQGPQGISGQGPQGDQGSTGSQGDQGPQGDQGSSGSQGDQGSTGPQGYQGDRGLTISQPPVSSVGTIGDLGGMLSFDESYIYYCIQDFGGATYSAYVLVGGDSDPSGILAIVGGNPTPEVGWNIYYDGNTGVINQSVPQGEGHVLFWDPPFTIPSDAIITYGPIPLDDIWVKQSWGVTGSW